VGRERWPELVGGAGDCAPQRSQRDRAPSAERPGVLATVVTGFL